MPKARVIAFYLPQFHPIPENDKWWGKGFTEWTNVAKAKPLFRGHYQPHIPADLGFYDLRLKEVREAQAQLAREGCIEGFCYWHYWFGNGKMLLERPFQEVLKSGAPDYPFCLGWANHDWGTGTWQNEKGSYKSQIIMKQEYLGESDYKQHFEYVLPAFKDARYIRVDNKPLFYIFAPKNIPDVKTFIECWQKLAVESGLDGIYFVGSCQSYQPLLEKKSDIVKKRIGITPLTYYNELFEQGFDGVNSRGENLAYFKSVGSLTLMKRQILKRLFHKGSLTICNQKDINRHLFNEYEEIENIYPTVIPNFDRSPRAGKRAVIWKNSSPEVFKEQIKDALKLVDGRPDEHKIIFLQSWNEWGEGNHVEPDLKFGHGYLDSLKELLKD